MGRSRSTTDHATIRRWAEARNGRPCRVLMGDGDPGLLRIRIPDCAGEEDLQEISWDEFFEKFEIKELALVYQEEASESEHKLIDRHSCRDE